MIRGLLARFRKYAPADAQKQCRGEAIAAAVRSRLGGGNPLLCNLGCGNRVDPHWINIDFQGDGENVLPWDLRDGVPLPDSSCDAIYSSHVIEHFNRLDARRFLLDCRRALKPSAILRLAAPNLEDIARKYIDCLDAARQGEPGASDKYDWIVLELLDQLVRHYSGGEMLKFWSRPEVPEEDFIIGRVGTEYLRMRGICRSRTFTEEPALDVEKVGRFRLGGEVHQWMYDSYSLARLVSDCGFEETKTCGASESRIMEFASFSLDTEPDGSTYKPDSFFLEAVRPA